MSPVAVAALGIGLCGCSGPPLPAGPGVIPLDGHPFAALPLADGTMLASVSRDDGEDGAIVVLRPAAAGFVVAGSFRIDGRPFGLAASHDGRLVAVAADRETLLLDRDRLVSGRGGDPVVERVGRQADAIEVAFSPDDRTLAISEERAGQVTLLPIGASGGPPEHVETGRAPVGLAFSPDGRWLYVVSEVATGTGNGCPTASGRDDVGPGTVSTIGLAPGAAPKVVGVARVGCAPVRIALSGDGGLALVSLRGEDRVAAFRTQALRMGRTEPVAAIGTGPAPVGLALSADDRTLRVANSDRFDPGEAGSVACVAVARDGSLSLVGRVASGAFPRELARLPDGRMVATLFGSDALQLLPEHC